MLLYLYKFSCFCYLANALPLQYILINEALLKTAIIFFTSVIACVLIFIILREITITQTIKVARIFYSLQGDLGRFPKEVEGRSQVFLSAITTSFTLMYAVLG